MEITGAKLFVKALQKEGVDTLFAYPGGQAIDLFDALYGEEDIHMILPRHEQGLVHAADGYARATGKVGVCLVTSGPGATNLVTGIATANFDSVPLVCFTGQVPLQLIGNDAFQEADIVGITRNISKWATTVRRREDLATVIKKAFYIARTGKPGVVVVDLPKNIQLELGSDEYPEEDIDIRSYRPNTEVHIGQVKRAVRIMKKAEKPLFLLGGGVNVARANEAMTALVEKTHIPVITTIMGKGSIPTDHPLYIGNLGIHGSFAANRAVCECDVLISIGSRFNDRITGKVDEFAKHAKIIHMDIDTASISRNIEVDVPIVGDATNAIAALQEYMVSLDTGEWLGQIDGWKKEHPLDELQVDQPGVTPYKIIREINRQFDKAMISTDVGQNQMWTTQYIEITKDKRLLTSGGLGTMGYGFPAAIGAKLGCPEHAAITVNGDGGFQMNLQELATAVIYELPVIICVLNNGFLGNVRQWQELFYDRHYSSTCLRRRPSCPLICDKPGDQCPKYTPDFVKLAESYGAKGIRVEREEEIAEAFREAAKETKRPTLIEFIIDREENVMPMVPPGKPLDDVILGD